MPTSGNIILSVIIPTKNRPHLLKRALTSVAGQSYPYFEVCVIDNNTNAAISSTVKATVNYFEQQYPQLVWKYVYSSKPFASGARNDGIDATQGRYIIFLDDDDELLSHSIETRVLAMQQYPHTALLYCGGYSVIYPYPFKMYRYYHYNKHLHPDRLMMMSCSSIMINREVFKAHNLYFDEQQSRMEDYDLCRRIIELDLKVRSIPQPLVQINLHPETRMSSQKIINYAFKEVLKEKWGPAADDVVFSYAEGVYIWRKCFGIHDQNYAGIAKALQHDFKRSTSLGFKLKYALVSVSPVLYLLIYHFAIFISQQYKNRRARIMSGA